MINRKVFIQLFLLICCLPLGEAYLLFHVPELRERDWFLLSSLKQDIEWYVKDTSEAVIWIVFLSVWYARERVRSEIFSKYILLFLIFRIFDLIMYWVNHRDAVNGYVICYVVFIFSLLYCFVKHEKGD